MASRAPGTARTAFQSVVLDRRPRLLQELQHERRALDFRRRRERVPGHRDRQLHVGDVLDQHREQPIVASSRLRRDPLGDLALQQEHRAADRCALVEQMKEDRRAQMVRQVPADDDPLVRAHRDLPQIEALCVGFRHFHAWKLGAQDGNQLPVALHRDDVRAGGCQRAGEMAEPGAQLDDGVTSFQPRQRGKRREQLLVPEEVLAPVLLRPQPVASEELGRFHSRHPGSADISGSARSPRRSR